MDWIYIITQIPFGAVASTALSFISRPSSLFLSASSYAFIFGAFESTSNFLSDTTFSSSLEL